MIGPYVFVLGWSDMHIFDYVTNGTLCDTPLEAPWHKRANDVSELIEDGIVPGLCAVCREEWWALR